MRGCGTMFFRVVVPQRVTLPSLKFEQAAICPDGPSPATGEGAGGAEPSAASGGCSEAEHPQRSKKSSKRAARRFFRAPQGGGGKCARGYLGSVSVRSTDDALHRSYPALQATERGSSRGKLSPLTVFWFLLYAQKERLRGERCLLCLCKRLHGADRRDEIITFCRQPLSHGYAVPAPLTQGSLWVCRQAR